MQYVRSRLALASGNSERRREAARRRGAEGCSRGGANRSGDVSIALLVLDVEPAPQPLPGAWVRDREVVIPVDADGFDAALAAVRASVDVIGDVTR